MPNREERKTQFNVTISYVSREVSAKDKIKMKDISDAVKINEEITAGNSLVIDVDFYALLDVHNEKAKNGTDYSVILIFDKNGQKYTTGSNSFINAFLDIADAIEEDGIEEYAVKVYGRASKNYSGKEFITCSLI